ncbi:MAG: methylamine utilization protein MauJ [Flavisolibacter sp.]
MPVITDENTRKALAFWREGLRLRHIHDGYSFLSFYKVIESQFADGRRRGAWINQTIPAVTGKAAERVVELQEARINVGDHIFQSGRCAVAHASLGGELVDPDIPEDRVRISKDLVLIQALAEKYIREELGVPDEMDIYKNRDALRPVYEYLDQAHIEELRNGGSVLRKKLGLNGLDVSINHWPHQPPQTLRHLKLSVFSAHNGTADLRASNDSGTLCLGFLLDFIHMKAHTNLDVGGTLPANQGGLPEHEIAFLEYRKAVIGNGQIEIKFPNGEKIVCEVVMPVNVDIGRTFSAIDKKISELQAVQQNACENESNDYGA